MATRLRRLGSKVCGVGGPLAGVLLGWTGAGTLHAQAPLNLPLVEQPGTPDPQPAQRNYLNKNHIKLPIQINEPDRPSLKEVQLYFKENRGSAWVFREKVAPTQKAFTIQLPRDGEYAFVMVTVNKQGKRDPEDLRNEPPGLVVVIDTQAPQIELLNLGQVPEGQLIQFDVKDANLDNGRTRFAYQGGDRVFRNIEPVPGKSNLFLIPAQAVFTGLMRASAEDLAGNTTVMEEHLSKLKTPTVLAQTTAPTPAVAPLVTPTTMVTQTPLPEVKLPEVPRQLPPILSNVPPITPALPTVEQNPLKLVPTRPDPNEHHLVERIPTQLTPTPVQQTALSVPAKRQIVNNPKMFLDYQLENVGSSGVGKLQLWITRDQSKTWTKLEEIAQDGSPLGLNLPGEGLYGITLVAVNGRGIAGAAPTAGEAPDWWIEVDTTKPTVELTKLATVADKGQNVVHIQWTAQDKNIGDAPVDLYYAATVQGPWLPIAKGLKAEGQHRWTPSAEIGTQAHIRLVVRDAAGNTTTVNTSEPVQIGDQVRPRATIRGISTNNPASIPLVPVEK